MRISASKSAHAPEQRKRRIVLGVREAAEYLGLSLTSAYGAINRGELPGQKVGGKWVIPRRQFFEQFGHAAKRRPRPRPSLVDETALVADRPQTVHDSVEHRSIRKDTVGRFKGGPGDLTAAQVAQQLGCTDRYVREKLCDSDTPQLRYEKRGSIYVFRQESVDDYRRSVTHGPAPSTGASGIGS